MKVAFATCVQLGLSCIEEIYRIKGTLDLIISLKDEKAINKSGRIYLDEISEKHNVPLLKIDNINDNEVIETIKKNNINWLFIVGWSQIAKSQLLLAPINGCIGMHPTLLPEGRGRASIPWAIIRGLTKTGVTLFKMDEGVDTGDIIGQVSISLNNRMTATELYEEINKLHILLISKYWNDIVKGNIQLFEQDESAATLWPQRKPSDGEILSSMNMDEASRLVRAVTRPYPGAFYRVNDKTIKVWSAEVNQYNGDFKLKDGFLIPVEFETEV